LAARLRGARFVYSSANVFDFDLGRVEPPYKVRLFECGVRAADEVVVQNDGQAEMCRQRFRRDPVVIRSIAEAAEPRQGVPEPFLWVGRAAPYKRLGVYLDLARDVPEARFQMIAVPGPDNESELASRLA